MKIWNDVSWIPHFLPMKLENTTLSCKCKRLTSGSSGRKDVSWIPHSVPMKFCCIIQILKTLSHDKKNHPVKTRFTWESHSIIVRSDSFAGLTNHVSTRSSNNELVVLFFLRCVFHDATVSKHCKNRVTFFTVSQVSAVAARGKAPQTYVIVDRGAVCAGSGVPSHTRWDPLGPLAGSSLPCQASPDGHQAFPTTTKVASTQVKGCLGDLPATAILPAAMWMSSSLKSSIGSTGSAESLSVGKQTCSAKSCVTTRVH